MNARRGKQRFPSPFFVALTLSIMFGIHSPEALALEEFAISVSPDPVTTIDPLIVTLTGTAPCAEFSEPFVGNGTIHIEFRGDCGIFVPPPSPFTVHRLVEPLPAGTWEVLVVYSDPVSLPAGLIGSETIQVTTPDFSLELTPSPATENDEVIAHATAFASEPLLYISAIEPGRIQLEVSECGLCDPPSPPALYQLTESLGRLAAGDYAAELFFQGSLVAESHLQVLPAENCLETLTALCLEAGRFRAEASWTTPDGDEGAATAVPETTDTGLFWFFNAANIELVVKVLNACDTEFNNFWVFAGGLTDVGVTLTVTDTQTGDVATYENPVGQPFETITDTAAFNTCP